MNKSTCYIVGKDVPLTYRECREWAAKYIQLNPQNAVRIQRDTENGGWKCKVTIYY